ncbi:MAG: efflux RND transporter periplasmic adaptor subunit [Candidatus Margulisiibacteriota bacterium]
MKNWLLVFGIILVMGIYVAGCAGTKPASAKVGDFYVTVAVQPDPPRVGDNTLKIKVFDAAGKAVKNAAIHFTLNMPAMGGMGAMSAHGGADLKGDAYEGPLSLSMDGTWDLRIELHIEGQPHLVADFKVTTGTRGISFISSRAEKMDESMLPEKNTMVRLSADGEKKINVKTEPAAFRRLTKEVRTVGVVAYDPELYVAQEEYIGAAGLKDEDLLNAARRKLKILGISEEQIEALKEREDSLLVGSIDGTIWIYGKIYESEIPLIRQGQTVKVTSKSLPGIMFEGEIASIGTVLDEVTRSLKLRAAVQNEKGLLKPNMYVDLLVEIPLGENLAVPEEAVMDTGERQIVFVDKGKGEYEQRKVTAGQKAEGYVEIIEGLESGEKVVTNGNFLIDSESKLKSTGSGGHVH